jgi:hypothetical protein
MTIRNALLIGILGELERSELKRTEMKGNERMEGTKERMNKGRIE